VGVGVPGPCAPGHEQGRGQANGQADCRSRPAMGRGSGWARRGGLGRQRRGRRRDRLPAPGLFRLPIHHCARPLTSPLPRPLPRPLE